MRVWFLLDKKASDEIVEIYRTRLADGIEIIMTRPTIKQQTAFPIFIFNNTFSSCH